MTLHQSSPNLITRFRTQVALAAAGGLLGVIGVTGYVVGNDSATVTTVNQTAGSNGAPSAGTSSTAGGSSPQSSGLSAPSQSGQVSGNSNAS